VTSGFVVDSTGSVSNQIDVIISDRQYTPFVLSFESVRYVAAESVYAVFEAKQEASLAHFQYAAEKAESVRGLFRTSAPIPTAAGTLAPKPLHSIIAGILTTTTTWSPPFGVPFRSALRELCAMPARAIDIGCVLDSGAFDVTNEPTLRVDTSGREDALITFFLRLLARLQAIGTVAAIDMSAYASILPPMSTDYIT
jgi:hypothetical protein